MTTQDALPGERQQTILRLLREHGRVMSAQLAVELQVSEDSIRRDLRELAAQGLCRKVHGGALPAAPAFPALAERHERTMTASSRWPGSRPRRCCPVSWCFSTPVRPTA
ncbi:DeoR family transcriptional regulator [Stenotrophomonas rhizophila]